MIWYLAFQLLGLAIFCTILYVVYLFTKGQFDCLLDYLLDHWKKILIGYGVMIAILTILCFNALIQTMKCSIHGTSMKTETSYSWVMKECLMKSRTGAMLPIKISRDQPEGSDHDVTN